MLWVLSLRLSWSCGSLVTALYGVRSVSYSGRVGIFEVYMVGVDERPLTYLWRFVNVMFLSLM